jgi:serine/threonine protein kinase
VVQESNFSSEVFLKNISDGCGYSKSIDIWSIGCVTATMLGHRTILPDFRSRDAGLDALDALNDPKVWEGVSTRAKEFIRGCLAPQEADRLTAREALDHKWFTHPHYRSDFDAAYKRAIQDWQPRPRDENVIEIIDTSHIKAKKTRSSYFEPPRPRPASSSRSSDQATMIARWRPDELRASPVVRDSYAFQEDESFVSFPENPPQSSPPQQEVNASQDEFQEAYMNDCEEDVLNERLYQASQNQATNCYPYNYQDY